MSHFEFVGGFFCPFFMVVVFFLAFYSSSSDLAESIMSSLAATARELFARFTVLGMEREWRYCLFRMNVGCLYHYRK